MGCARDSAGSCSRAGLYRSGWGNRFARRPRIGWRPVRILIFHGYLLGGTGSNVYNARLAEALVRLGHEVHLISQERHPEEHGFLAAAADWDSGGLQVRELAHPAEGPGRAVLYRPDIGGLLPVYVADRYESLETRTFAECSPVHVARYVAANAAAPARHAALAPPPAPLATHRVACPLTRPR